MRVRSVLFAFVPQVKQADVVVTMGAEHTALLNTCLKPGVTLINCSPASVPGVCPSHTLVTPLSLTLAFLYTVCEQLCLIDCTLRISEMFPAVSRSVLGS